MPPVSIKEKGEASGSAGGRTVPAKRHFSSLKVVVVVDNEEEVRERIQRMEPRAWIARRRLW
jgi:hypothetical protein